MTNPFSSHLFSEIWLKHFNHGKPAYQSAVFDGISFVKAGFPGYYVNVGKNLTKGITYAIDPSASDFKNKVFLLYDIPSYFNINSQELPKGMGFKSSYQYKGYLMDLSGVDSTEAYINSRFSGKNRREFRSNIRRLEQCFRVSYEFIENSIEKEKFDQLFEQFNQLLKKRYKEKGTTYHHLAQNKWAYYLELVYAMINEGTASLLVIRNGEEPIGITLNFHSEDILFETMTVFDQDYFKFSIGKTSIIKLLDWCFANNTATSDFSKGAFEYKEKWANTDYDFNYHIYYDKRSFVASAKAFFLYNRLELKRFLREKEVNKVYRKLQFLLKGKKSDKPKFKIEKLEDFHESSDYSRINLNDESFSFLKIYAYTFLFAKPQSADTLEIYKKNDSNEFVLKGEKGGQRLIPIA